MTTVPGSMTGPVAPKMQTQSCLVGEQNGFRRYHIDNPAGSALDELARIYGFHELAVEDCRVPGNRAKIDEYGETLFVVANVVKFNLAHDECSFTELDFFLRENLVISVCDGTNQVVDAVRDVFPSECKLANPGRLFRRLLDAMVDRYLPVLDSIEKRIEHSEEKHLCIPQQNCSRTPFH